MIEGAHRRHLRADTKLQHEGPGGARHVSAFVEQHSILCLQGDHLCVTHFCSYDMRVSGALQRMGHIAHESLRSCSMPLIDGSMRDERAEIQLNLAVIDSEL